MLTPSQPTNLSTPSNLSELAKADEHLAPIPAYFLPALVPFGEGQELQIPAIHYDGYASFGYCAPQPDRNGIHFEHVDYPYCGQFNGSTLTQAAENRMRQAYELQTRLSADTIEIRVSPPETYPEVVRLNFEQLQARRQWTEKKRDVLVRLQTGQLSGLHKLVELTRLLFKRLRMTEPSGMSITPLALEMVSLMKIAGFEMPKEINPLGLYQAICRRLLVQEAEVAALGLEILREEIQLVRMGLYAETGLLLRAQAQTVMAGYHLPENALLIDTEDDIYQHYQHLELVVENPIDTRWPAPEQPEISDDLGHWS